jgi:AGZA family xanthine/uracil permease-like MFS transporter
MIAAAVSVFLIEREFLKASLWSAAAALMAFFGVIHSYEFSGNETVSVLGWNAGGPWALGWFAFALVFIAFHFWERAVKKRTGRGFEIQEH